MRPSPCGASTSPPARSTKPWTGEIILEVDPAAAINAVRLTGRIGLGAGLTLGSSHAVNGDKVLPIPKVSGSTAVTLRWRYRMGAGLGSLRLECEAAASAAV